MATKPRIAPYGSWTSPLTAERMAADVVGFTDLFAVGDDLYWVEHRPGAGGRHVLVRLRPDGAIADVTPGGFDVRSAVNRSNGWAATAGPDGTAVFVHGGDQQLYAIAPAPGGSAPVRLTPGDRRRYLHPVIDGARGRVIAVADDGASASIVAVPITGGEPAVLAAGHDFYGWPALSPAGDALAFVCWDAPNMPWDDTEVHAVSLDAGGRVTGERVVAGSPGVSVGAPSWSPQGRLFVVSDERGRWMLDGVEHPGEVNPLLRSVALGRDGAAYLAVVDDGVHRVVAVDLERGTSEDVDVDVGATWIGAIAVTGDGRVAVLGASPTFATSVVVAGKGLVRPAAGDDIDHGYLPAPERIEYPTSDGASAFAYFYRPANPAFAGPAGERPPVLALAHGGPTSATTIGLRLGAHAPVSPAYWTSRGFAVVDVDYRGSTGYGTAYRRALYGRWGEADVVDVVRAVEHLHARGDVDGSRAVVCGRSAGGFIALAALAFHDAFAGGIDLYGVADIESFAAATDRYLRHYADHLAGSRSVFRERSPLHAVDRIDAPLLVVQGLDDPVMPASQSDAMVAALRARGVPVEYVAFGGEGHGFVRSSTIVQTLEAMEAFLRRVLVDGHHGGV